MVRLGQSVLIMIIALILHDKLPRHIAVAGIGPDFALLGLFLVTLRSGPAIGVWFGFVGGLFLDVAVPESLGARALSLGVASFVTGRFAEQVDTRSIIVQLVLLALMGGVNAIVYEVTRYLTEPWTVITNLTLRDVPTVTYTLALAGLLLAGAGGRLLPARSSWKESG